MPVPPVVNLPRNSLTRKHKNFLLQLFRASKNPQRVAQLLRKANSSQIQALSEVAFNLLQRKIPVRATFLKKLYPYRGVVRLLANRKTPVNQKKKLLLRANNTQTGGVLPFLIPFLAPIAGTLAAAGIEQLL